MKLSAQEEYGLRCLLYLGRQGAGASCTIAEISQAEGISLPNVAKMMRILRQGGFVESTRGQAGGYRLVGPADSIRVGAVLNELGGRLYEPGFCERFRGAESLCRHSTDCSLRTLWGRLQHAVDDAVADLTLQDLLPRAKPEAEAVDRRLEA